MSWETALNASEAVLASVAAYALLRWRRELARLSYVSRRVGAERCSERWRSLAYPKYILSPTFHLILATVAGALMALVALRLWADVAVHLAGPGRLLSGEPAVAGPAKSIGQIGTRDVLMALSGLVLAWGAGAYLFLNRVRAALFAQEVYREARRLERGTFSAPATSGEQEPTPALVRLATGVALMHFLCGIVWVWVNLR